MPWGRRAGRTDVEIVGLKQQRKQTEHHIPVKSLPEEERFTRLPTERKHFLDTIKMIAYRAETSLVSLLRENLARSDDARTLIRQIFETEADLFPDATNKILTVQIHHLTQAAHDQVLEKLCAALNETQTVFPGTELVLSSKIGSSLISPRSGGLEFGELVNRPGIRASGHRLVAAVCEMISEDQAAIAS